MRADENHNNLEYLSDISQMELHPFTLSFTGASGSLEKAYIRYLHNKHAQQVRLVLAVALTFYAVFGILDGVLVPGLQTTFWAIRGMFISCMVFLMLLTFTGIARRYLQPLLASVGLLAGAGIIAMVVIAPSPASYLYYAGLILVFMFLYTFGKIRFVWATASGWLIVLWYEIAVLVLTDTPAMIMLNNNFFFIAANIIGMISCYLIEYYTRRDYFMTCMLDSEQKKTSRANKDLERRVRQRTSLLISTNEDLKAQIAEKKKVENALRMMQEELEDKVRERTDTLSRMNEKLTKAKEYADASVRSKTEFLANMSHEIRTPMNAIIGMSDLAMNVNLQPEQRKEYLDIIRTSARSLLGIINDILDLSKIESGKLQFEKMPFKLRELIETVSDMFLDKIQAKGIEFIVDVASDVPVFLTGDPLRLKQVLVNLTSNALKFTDHGEICISVRVKHVVGKKMILAFDVRDTGIGIKRDQCYDLFEAFAQADGSTSRKYGGTGLGLAICRNIVKMMNGAITVQSDEGVGSTFSFTIELEKHAGERRQGVRSQVSVKGLRTLVVENKRSLQKVLTRMLESFGFITGIAESGQAALSVLTFNRELDKTPIGLILIDSELPDMNGKDLVEKILGKTDGDPPPLIIMGTGQAEDRDIGKDYPGVHHYLVKPVKPSVLLDKVMDIFGGRSVFDDEQAMETKESRDDFHGMRVLLVEDNPVNQMVATEMLTLAGVVVSKAENGLEALATLGQQRFDAVLMDIQMPEMDGFETTTIIRNRLGMTDLPIIAMTAHAMQGDREKCLDAGMDDYIAKPIENDSLFTALGKCLKVQASTDRQTSSSHPVIGDIPYHPEGVDVNEGIGRMDGNVERYIEIVVQFCKHFQSAPGEIKAAIDNQQYDEIKYVVHSIKGAAANISAYTVREIAELMEQAHASGNFALIETLTDTMNTAIDDINASFGSLSPVDKKQAEPVSDMAFHLDTFRALAEKLDKSLEEYDPADSRIYFDEIQKYFLTANSGNHLRELWQKLETAIYVYQFDEARIYIRDIEKEMV